MRSLEYVDKEELESYKAEQWMIDLLKCNPSYTCWGPYEDYMTEKGQWNEAVFKNLWAEFEWGLDELNECVHFYFEVEKKTEKCPHCENGYTPKAYEIRSNLGYDANTYDKDVIEALQKEYPGHNFFERFFGVDSLRQNSAVRYICQRDGITYSCPHCNGEGYVMVGPTYVNLVLWMIHPRKGCSRGVEIKNIKQTDLPSIYKWLDEARTRNNDRFKGIDLLKDLKEKTNVRKKSKS